MTDNEIRAMLLLLIVMISAYIIGYWFGAADAGKVHYALEFDRRPAPYFKGDNGAPETVVVKDGEHGAC